jgi:hypothetical protein
MVAPGETDLQKMLDTLAVQRRPGVFTYVAVTELTSGLSRAAHATVQEEELVTVVLDAEIAADRGFDVLVRLAWLTLTVHSSLEAVGLTAAVSARLTEAGISCNVLAGIEHDHLLVPVARVDDAIAALTTSGSISSS